MATIVLRSAKGSPLSISEGDSNFSNLNNEKIERNGSIDFTAPQAFVLGSVDAPSIKPVGSSTTGLYFPSTSSVAISIGGTQKLLVDASGITADGANLTNLNASNLASGTVPSARLSGSYQGINAVANVLSQADIGVSGASGVGKGFLYTTNGVLRWYTQANSTAETGSNAGSDFSIHRYDDAGNYLGTPFTITRSSGNAVFSGNVNAASFSGNGSELTNLNASNLASGTVPSVRISTVPVYFNQSDIGVTASAGTNRGFRWGTNSSLRWYLGTDTAAESGGNAGSNLDLYRYDDSGSPISIVLSFSRASGVSLFYGGTNTVPVSVAFSATPTFNAQQSNVFYFGTLTGNVTSMTISNPSDGQTIQIRFVQDATGSRTVALPSGAVVSGSINSAANSVTWLVMTYVSSAARWEGTWTRIS